MIARWLRSRWPLYIGFGALVVGALLNSMALAIVGLAFWLGCLVIDAVIIYRLRH